METKCKCVATFLMAGLPQLLLGESSGRGADISEGVNVDTDYSMLIISIVFLSIGLIIHYFAKKRVDQTGEDNFGCVINGCYIIAGLLGGCGIIDLCFKFLIFPFFYVLSFIFHYLIVILCILLPIGVVIISCAKIKNRIYRIILITILSLSCFIGEYTLWEEVISNTDFARQYIFKKWDFKGAFDRNLHPEDFEESEIEEEIDWNAY